MNEKEEEHQQNRKQKNFMVFGASESKEVTDEEFIKDLIKDVGVNADVKFFMRIGNQTKKSRPIKVVLGTAHERWLSCIHWRISKIKHHMMCRRRLREKHDTRVDKESK